MADVEHTSGSSNVVPFPRSAMRAAHLDGETVIAIWPRAGLGDTIRPHDIIEVELSPKVAHDGVYLIQIGSMPELRRVQILDDGRARVTVDGWANVEIIECDALVVVGVTRHWRAA